MNVVGLDNDTDESDRQGEGTARECDERLVEGITRLLTCLDQMLAVLLEIVVHRSFSIRPGTLLRPQHLEHRVHGICKKAGLELGEQLARYTGHKALHFSADLQPPAGRCTFGRRSQLWPTDQVP